MTISGASSASLARAPHRAVVLLLGLGVAALLTGCASQNQVRTAGVGIDPRYGVKASPRVVADGEPVPKGGGMNMVGKPYTIAGRTYYPSERTYSAVGLASWYGSDFHGRRTANGEVFDRMSISAAHPTMPLPSYARVTNLRNNYSMIVRVNDRGPYHANRIMDVSEQVAQALDFRRVGTARVRVDFVGRASLAGSDDSKLLASLRTNGPAGLDHDVEVPTLIGSQDRQPAREPVRMAAIREPVADAEEASAPRDDADDATPAPPVRTEMRHAAAPKPPARPVDLSTIPGAGVPIAAPKQARARAPARDIQALLQDEDAPLPPRR